MKNISILISSQSKSAYFDDFVQCAIKELEYCLPHLKVEYKKVGLLNFLQTTANDMEIKLISKLSFFEAIFQRHSGENANKLTPLDIEPGFLLPESFIYGSKFKGKTNERFTQMMLNIGIASISKNDKIKILDPMCGRATTLLWSLSYGFNAKGIELDPKALVDINQIVKKWSKISKTSAKMSQGYIGKKTKSNIGKFLECKTDNANFRVITGSSTKAQDLLSNEKFDLIISDIPYGIQHLASKQAKNPLETLSLALPQWSKCLTNEGAIIIGHNSNNPKSDKIAQLASENNLEVVNFSIAHRMSESIVRDVIVLKK